MFSWQLTGPGHPGSRVGITLTSLLLAVHFIDKSHGKGCNEGENLTALAGIQTKNSPALTRARGAALY